MIHHKSPSRIWETQDIKVFAAKQFFCHLSPMLAGFPVHKKTNVIFWVKSLIVYSTPLKLTPEYCSPQTEVF